MPDYERMYYELFSSMTRAILILPDAQKETADMLVKSIDQGGIIKDREESEMQE